jgi:glutamate racemase
MFETTSARITVSLARAATVSGDHGATIAANGLLGEAFAPSRAFRRPAHLESWRAVTASAPPPRERPIAVFDSGVGGLTVLQELLVELPHEDFLYLGDTARFPYGERSAAELERFSLEISELLLARRAKLLVVACNAASSAALGAVRERMLSTTLGVEVLGVIEPESRIAAERSRNRRIGLLATTATVASGAYDRALLRYAPDATLTSVACPDLAPIIQLGFPFDRRVVEIVRAYCEPLREADVDTVILGCTHYPLVAPMLQRMLGPAVALVSSCRALAASVAATLERAELGSPHQGEGTYRFLCTGDVETFRALGSRFLQMPIEEIEQVQVESAVAA